MALPQHNRLRSSRDFSRVYRQGKRAATKHLAVRALAVKALSVKNQGRSASKRNAVPDAAPDKVAKSKSARSVDGSPSALLLRSEQRPVTKATARALPKLLKEPRQGPLFGISISRKVHKRAVVRNRIKRQIKAILREWCSAIAPEWQIVIVVRPPAVECSFDDFLRELEYLLQKLSVLSR